MKKIIAVAVILLMGFGAMAQNDAFFTYESNNIYYNRYGLTTAGTPNFPEPFNGVNQNATAPLGSGLLVLTALGASYAVSRRRKK